MNNPFIRYKIYSTAIDKSSDLYLIKRNVKVLCLITSQDIERQQFLKKILSAAKINESNYQLIVLDKNDSISAANLHWFDQLDYILCFGLSAEKIDVNIPFHYYQNFVIINTKIIQLPDLGNIESDKNEKKQLWLWMKNEFIHE